MNYFYKYVLKSFIISSLINYPIHAVVKSLSDYYLENTEVTIIGDTHIGGGHPNEQLAQEDAQHYDLVKQRIQTWNSLQKPTAFLIESNQYILKQNRATLKQQKKRWPRHIPLPYWGMYYMLPEHACENQENLPNINFTSCDMRKPAFWQTKEEIILLQSVFEKIKKILNTDKSAYLDKDAFQQTMGHLESNQISAKKFLNELEENANTIEERLFSLEDSQLDDITPKKILEYIDSIRKAKKQYEIFFKQHLGNDLEKPTLQAFIHHVTQKAKLDENDQSRREIALACAQRSLQILREVTTEYEKATNHIADAGFILTLQEKRKKYAKIAIFCGNNHAVELQKYLQTYADAGKGKCRFKQGFSDYDYEKPHQQNLSYKKCRQLFQICLNPTFKDKEFQDTVNFDQELTQTTKPYLCTKCDKSNFFNKYQHCGKCRNTYYCSRECQENDWSMHKKNCIKK